jgi:hypothetical protein
LHCYTVDFQNRLDVEAPVRRDDQDQGDGDDAPTPGYPVVPVRRDLPSRSLAPAMGTKGGGKATAILNLDLT